MRFGNGYYAYGFWIILILVIFFFLAEKSRKKALGKFAEPGLLNEIASRVSPKKRHVKFAVIVIAFLLSVLALMRPQWGFKWQEVKRQGMDILVAVDTSKSMLAADVKPNRLSRSKLAVRDLVKKLRGDRIGLIAFSGTAYLQCPLTVDYGGFLLALSDLSTLTIPHGGTSISSAIKIAEKSFESTDKKFRLLVIITDGEDHDGKAERAAESAKKEGIKIFCVGIGTKEGELIQVMGEDGKKVFLKDRAGNIVKSMLDENVLQRIAFTTGGTYVRSSGAEFGLDLLYEEKFSKMEKREIKAQMQKLYHERFQIPLALALGVILLELIMTDRKRTR